jgi:hypothetical protein
MNVAGEVEKELAYDDASHEYRRGAKILPGVTQVMGLLTEGKYKYATPAGQQRGTDVHELIARWENAKLGEEIEVPGAYVPYMNNWLEFKKYNRLGIPFGTELKLASRFRYAGRLDLLYRDTDKYGDVLLDIKTYKAEERLAGIQTAAYLNLVRENRPGDLDWHKVKRMMVIIPAKGKYTLVPLRNFERDFAYFLNCLSVTHLQKIIGGES